MLFNSLTFAVFLPVVFLLYWTLLRRSWRLQNAFLLVASYVFYGWWDWRFLVLIVFSTGVDYAVGLWLHRADASRRRKLLLVLSLVTNLGLLGVFKYYGFFVESFQQLIGLVGLHADVRTLQVILPVGISFYTFQSMSYSIDIYRRQIEPCRDPIAVFAYVGFFPQLVAGPIERAGHLLPQFRRARRFVPTQAADGLRQILWGLFKKVVIADNLAAPVEAVFANCTAYDAPDLFLGTLYFAVQIYCDFSGYSDIAVGTARLFGFDLKRNFACPYFSRDIAEFWRRWHISLSSWFRDYVYIPLGGSRVATRSRHFANIIVVFALSGLWHGAEWTFVIWGLLHGLYYLPLIRSGRHRRHLDLVATGRLLPRPREAVAMAGTFSLVLFAWIFFRADSVTHALDYIERLAGTSWLTTPEMAAGLPYVLVVLIVEWLQRDKTHALQITGLPRWARWIVYYALIAVLFLFGHTGHVPFIYFQF